jgi:hypothetical protein
VRLTSMTCTCTIPQTLENISKADGECSWNLVLSRTECQLYNFQNHIMHIIIKIVCEFPRWDCTIATLVIGMIKFPRKLAFIIFLLQNVNNTAAGRHLHLTFSLTGPTKEPLGLAVWNLLRILIQSKAVPLHAMVALGGRGGITPTHLYLGTR